MYPVQLLAGTTYDIRLHTSNGKKLYVRLEDGAGTVLATSINQKGIIPRVSFTPFQPGEYRVIATSINGDVGPHTVTVTTRKKN